MKKFGIIVFTITLLAWGSIGQASIVASYENDGGIGQSWDGDNLQLTAAGKQTSLPVNASGTFDTGTSGDEDPTITLYNAIDNDTTFTWDGYHIWISANKPISIAAPANADYPTDWSITASPTDGTNCNWVVIAVAGTPVVVGDALDFGFQMTFTGGLSYKETLVPVAVAPVPEPGTLVLMLSGLLGLAAASLTRRRRT